MGYSECILRIMEAPCTRVFESSISLSDIL